MKKLSLSLFLCVAFMLVSMSTFANQSLRNVASVDTVNLAAGDNGVVMVSSDTIRFFDNGGAEGKYTTDGGFITFKPSSEGKIVKAIVKMFRSDGWHELFVYNGLNSKSEELEELSGTSVQVPIEFLGTSENGALTFEFDASYGDNTYEGWKIDIVEYTPLPLSQGEIKAQVIDESLMRGANHVIFRIDYEVAGDMGEHTIPEFNMDFSPETDMSKLVKIEMFSTDTLSAFAPVDGTMGVISDKAVSFAVNDKFTMPGVYKYWVRMSVAPDAGVGSTISATMNNVEFAGTVAEAFNGTYSIGASEGADYANFESAIAAMNGGIDGAVIFNIEVGTYKEQIKFVEVKGASATNTITFQSLSGEQDVIVEYNSQLEDDDHGAITIGGTDYLTLRNLRIITTNSYSPAVFIKNVSTHVTLSGLEISAPYTTGYSGDPYCVYVKGENIAHSNCDYFTMEDCRLIGGRIGVNIGGAGYVALPKQRGARILRSHFEGQASMGIYMQQEIGFEISGNTVVNTVSEISGFKAIDFVAMAGAKVSNNRVNLSTENYASGLYMRARNDEGTEATMIFNNEIIFSNIGGTYASYGINSSDPLVYTHIAYNSILMNASEVTNSMGIYVNTTAKGACVSSSIKHNIVKNMSGGIAIRTNSDMYFSDGNLSLANNMYFTNGTVFGSIGEAEVAMFADWAAITSEVGSANVEADFLSPNVLDLRSSTGMISQSTESYAAKDIMGRERGANAFPGAYAYAETVEELAPEFAEGYPKFSDIEYNKVVMSMKTSAPASMQYIMQESSLAAPTKEDVMLGTKTELSNIVTTDTTIANLAPQTTYKAYIILSTLRGTSSEIMISEEFTTTSRPTAVATFEDVKTTEMEGYDFEDGTAAFKGFSVIEDNTAMGNNTKVAKATVSGARVSITNVAGNLILDGFYLNSDADVTIKSLTSEGEEFSKELSTNGEWIFVNLRDAGATHHIELMFAEGADVKIDDFCGVPQPLEMILSGADITEGSAATLEYIITGGVIPYSYAWLNAANEVLSNEADCAIEAIATGDYSLEISDAWAGTVRASATINVIGTQKIADFENLHLENESHKPGNWTAEEDNMTHFYSGSFKFSTFAKSDWISWGLFGYSNETSTEYSTYEDQFRNVVGSGINGSENYCIAYPTSMFGTAASIKTTHTAEGDTVKGMYITNTAWVESAILNGDGVTVGDTGFGQNDSLMLTVIGMLDDTSTENDRMSIPLADYRNANAQEHYYLDSWQWIDLSSLGKVDEVRFEITGSKNGAYGLNTPSFFAIDNLGDVRPDRSVEAQELTASSSIDLSTLTTFNAADAAIQYDVLEQSNNINVATVEGSTLKLAMEGSSGEIVVQATQRGKRDFMRIPLKTTNTSTDNINNEDLIKIWAVDGNIHVACSADDYKVEIFSLTGIALHSQNNLHGTSIINVGVGNKVLVVRVTTANSSSTHRVMIR